MTIDPRYCPDMRSKARPTSLGPFRAEHLRSGDPYELSDGRRVNGGAAPDPAIFGFVGTRDNTARRIQPRHERIVEELAALPESDRHAIVEAADEEARRRARAVASWETIESLTGLVQLGGDAVEDCRRV
jgi:hypothetical protein